jgi:hypothetical protein
MYVKKGTKGRGTGKGDEGTGKEGGRIMQDKDC